MGFYRYSYIKDRNLLLILILIGYLLILRNLEFQSNNDVQWLFSVQNGFYSRALIGTITQEFFPKYYGSLLLIRSIALLITVTLTSALIYLSYRYWLINKNYFSLLITGVFLTSPGAIQFFARDSGRFDQIGYIFLLALLYFMPLLNRKTQLIIICIGSIVLVLIHEVHLLLLVPVLISHYLTNNIEAMTTTKQLAKQLFCSFVIVLPSILIVVLILLYGRFEYTPEQFENAVNILQHSADFKVPSEYWSLVMIHFRSVGDNLLFTCDFIFSRGRMLNLFFAFLSLLPSAVVGLFFLSHVLNRVIKNNQNRYVRLAKTIIILCCVIPLSAALIGIDYPRWMAVANNNLFLLGIIISIQMKVGFNNSKLLYVSPILNSSVLLMLIIVFNLALGPISATQSPESFKLMVSLIERVFSFF